MFTALIIAALIMAGAASTVGGALLVSRKRNALPGGGARQLTAGSAGDLDERDFTELRVDDVVQYSGQDYMVEGVINYDEAGHRWSMAHLVDGGDDQWLLVGLERTGGSSKRLLKRTTDVELNGYPPEVILVGKERYTFDKRGTATTSLHGNTGSLGGNSASQTGNSHRCRWWNYHAPGTKALLVEQWGEDYRVLIGKTVSDSEIDMMPGS